MLRSVEGSGREERSQRGRAGRNRWGGNRRRFCGRRSDVDVLHSQKPVSTLRLVWERRRQRQRTPYHPLATNPLPSSPSSSLQPRLHPPPTSSTSMRSAHPCGKDNSPKEGSPAKGWSATAPRGAVEGRGRSGASGGGERGGASASSSGRAERVSDGGEGTKGFSDPASK